MLSKSPDLLNNLSEILSKSCRDKNCKSECEFRWLENNKLSYNCKECREKQLKPINGLIKIFPNTYKFYNGDINNRVLLLKKDVYPYKYMDSWKRFNEIIASNKNAFYSKINLQSITNEDYIHAQKVFEELKKTKNLGEYHDLHVQSDTLLLTDAFENFRNKFMNLILLVFICTGISMVNLFKSDRCKLRIVNK